MMETSSSEFPGFQICVHKDEFEYKRSLSRLQRRAPRPLQIKPPKGPVDQCKSGTNEVPTSAATMAASSTSSLNSFFNSKDPIPLLSPLVLPSLLDSAFIQEGNAAVSI